MKTTPTQDDWKKFNRWTYRFKKEGVSIPTEGNIIESIERMEREHPELTTIPDKALEMKRLTTIPDKALEMKRAGKERIEKPDEVPEEEEIPEEKELFTERPISKVDPQTHERDITVVLRLKFRVEVEEVEVDRWI